MHAFKKLKGRFTGVRASTPSETGLRGYEEERPFELPSQKTLVPCETHVSRSELASGPRNRISPTIVFIRNPVCHPRVPSRFSNTVHYVASNPVILKSPRFPLTYPTSSQLVHCSDDGSGYKFSNCLMRFLQGVAGSRASLA